MRKVAGRLFVPFPSVLPLLYRTLRRFLPRPSFVVLLGLAALALPLDARCEGVFEPAPSPRAFWASRTPEEIVVDGSLNETAWQRAEVITGFVQKAPVQQSAASHPTTVRVLFDDEALYVGAVCYQPRNATRVQNLQRDFSFDENDLFGIALDGFLDRRNAVVLQTTPHGNQRDLEVIEGSEANLNWDARWTVRTRIADDHWTAEIAIPWRTLRYPPGTDRLGVIFARSIRSLNEQTSMPAVPRVFEVHQMAYEGELRGIETPPSGSNIQVNPYVIANRLSKSGDPGQSEIDGGVDMKWSISPSTVLDATWNTDFAQADVDRQVVNLERFNVFFPERRQFFLESASIFSASVTEWISPFFSRRIGLDRAGNPIPLDGGLRLTSRSPTHQLGVLAMHQQSLGESPSATFAVGRYSRNLSDQSRLGGMVTYRHDASADVGGVSLDANDNATYTIDGLWRPTQPFGIQGMLSVSKDDQTGDGLGGQIWAFYRNGRVELSSLQYYSKDYNPGIGLELLETDYIMHNLTASYDFRSERLPGPIRSFNPGVSAFLFRSATDGGLLFGYAPIRPLRLRFHNGAQFDFHVEPNRQKLTETFSPAGLEVAPGDYAYTRYRLSATSDQSARAGASVSVEGGGYFDGRLTSYSVSGRFVPSPHVELSADLEINQLRDLGAAAADATTRLYGVSARIAPNPRLQFSTFYQRDSLADRNVWSLRLSWEYRPLSYIYLVYNRNERNEPPGAGISGDQLIAKLTYMLAR